MSLKLLLMWMFLAAFIIPAQSRRIRSREPRFQSFGHPPSRPQSHFDSLFDFQSYDDNDGEDFDTDWVFQLQEPDGQCNPNPCLNNGVCEETGWRSFKCNCPGPFKGKKCQKVPRLCRRGTCGQGDCVLTTTAPFYECKCIEPYQLPNCVKASEVCNPNPCQNGGKCVRECDHTDAFSCQCPSGFSGHLCNVGPDDCYEGNGEGYRGTVSETENGVRCLHWNSVFILQRGTDPFTTFEDADGLGPHNFCRNPDGDRQPWCFIKDGRRLHWEHCDVKRCSAADDWASETTTATDNWASETTTPTDDWASETTTPTDDWASETMTPTDDWASETTTSTDSPVEISTDPSAGADPQFSTCGKPQPMRVINRIYGGLKAIPGAQPWQLSLQSRRRGSDGYFEHVCGAVLINSCWALTAAHCIDIYKEMQVMAGSLTLDSDEPDEQIIEVEKAIPHESYDFLTNSKDIALLKLKASYDGVCAKETRLVKAACLPDTVLPDGKECTISGWGSTEEASGSNHLLDAEVLLISQQTCSRPEVYGTVLDEGMLCAGYLKGEVDTCQGDSGGPLTCEHEGRHLLYGLVSWGDSCAQKNKPGVYVRVTHFLDWIKTNMEA